MTRFFLMTSALLMLGACATILDRQTQEVTMRTPGAENARCVIQNKAMKYIAFTDETIEIMKSPHDLVVNCKAPGNREQTIHVKRVVNEWVVANVANGFIPGATYDYFSRGAFDYPETLTVSFVGDKVRAYPLPAYEAEDLKDNRPHDDIEYMGPGTKVTNETRNMKPYELKKKEALYGESAFGSSVPDARKSSGDDIHKRYNPTVSYDPTEEDK